MLIIRLTGIGNDLAIILPADAAVRLNVEEGDIIYLTEFHGGHCVSSNGLAFEEQMVAAERIMKKRRSVLRTLAK